MNHVCLSGRNFKLEFSEFPKKLLLVLYMSRDTITTT